MLERWGDKINPVYHHILVEMVGSGRSPKTTVAAIKYLTTDKNQSEVADEVGCTEVSLRNCRDAILELGYFPEKK